MLLSRLQLAAPRGLVTVCVLGERLLNMCYGRVHRNHD
jgi:hypothetical protein